MSQKGILPQGAKALLGSRFLKVAACIAVLAAINLFVFRDHWAGRASFTFDFPMGYYAATAYWITSVQCGEWPHWIPYEGMGYPSALNPQLGLFYPPFWIFVLFKIPYTLHAANIFQLAHILFSSIGFLLLTWRAFRSWTVALAGGVCFALFGGFFTNAEHTDIIRAYTWVPWILWAILLLEKERPLEFGKCSITTRLSSAILLAPLIIGWFITGAYSGVMISVLAITGAFIVVQALLGTRSQTRKVAVRDGAIQLGAVALGIAMAAVFLIPTAILSHELTRTQTASRLPHWYLRFRDVIDFLYPSNYFPSRDIVTTGDYSMLGMQIPIAILALIPLGVSKIRRILPLVLIGGCAVLMCFREFQWFSRALLAALPVLGLSRFPAGDYRIFVYIALLMCALCGFERVYKEQGLKLWPNLACMCIANLIFLIEAVKIIAKMPAPIGGSFAHVVYVLALYGVVGIAISSLWSAAPRLKGLLVILFIGGLTGSGIYVAHQMQGYWEDPNIENFLYNQNGLKLESHGQLAVQQIFAKSQITRPPRKSVIAPVDLSWRGYIDGSYMLSDIGSVMSISRYNIDANPNLIDVMRQGNQLYAESCSTDVCRGRDINNVAIKDLPVIGHSLRYSRNFIIYSVDLPSKSLVLENEIYIPGWHAVCTLHGRQFSEHRIDGGLRGWVIPPGKHTLKVFYLTPYLSLGTVISAIGYLLWATILATALWFAIKRHDTAIHLKGIS